MKLRLGPAAPFLLAALLALGAASNAMAVDCPNVPLPDRIDAADGAFVGRVSSSRPAGDGERVYRFFVDQPVKGEIGREVEVRGPLLVDAADQPVPVDVPVGVLVQQDGASWTTESCLLTDPGALLSASDEARGNWIKVLIGIGILALVLVYSLRRLQRRQTARSGGDPSTNGRPRAS